MSAFKYSFLTHLSSVFFSLGLFEGGDGNSLQPLYRVLEDRDLFELLGASKECGSN